MESIKHKLGIAVLVLCLVVAAAVIWYLVAGLPDGTALDGTLVRILGGKTAA